MSNIMIVGDVIQLAQLIREWHDMRIRGLKRVVQASEGTTIQTKEGPLTLSGDTLLAFRTGIQLGLELFTDIPLLDVEDTYNQGPYAH